MDSISCSIRARSSSSAGEEAHHHAVGAERRKLEPGHLAEEGVGELDQDPRAVAGGGVRTLGAAVLQVHERRDRALDGLAGDPAVEPGEARHAAAVVFMSSPIQAVS